MANLTRQQWINRIDQSLDSEASTKETLATITAGENPDGTSFALPVTQSTASGIIASDFHLQTTADNALASVTKAAPAAGTSIHLSTVEGSFTGAGANAVLLIRETNNAGTVIARYVIRGDRQLHFAVPLKLTAATALYIELAASGTAGIIGHLSAHGFTRA